VVRAFAQNAHAAAASGDVVIPELVGTLEWVLDSPPNVHQFDEPPVSFFRRGCFCYARLTRENVQIVVEIEHLKNLHVEEH
jgi:heme/copper-type cytochrome/quinol oxidase subunit 1